MRVASGPIGVLHFLFRVKGRQVSVPHGMGDAFLATCGAGDHERD